MPPTRDKNNRQKCEKWKIIKLITKYMLFVGLSLFFFVLKKY